MRDQEKLFAQEWMQDHNAYKAALRAGYTNATARNAAAWIHPEHPTKPKLRDYLDRLLAQQSRRLGISADRVLNEIAKVAFVNAADVIDFETGQVKKDAKPEDLAAIAKVRVKHGEITEYEILLSDKNRSLEMLGKHLGMFAATDRGQEDALGKLDDILKEFKNATKPEAT